LTITLLCPIIVLSASGDAEAACLADALADPGSAESYSAEGHRRIGALAVELARLRMVLSHAVTDLVGEVRRVIGVDAEVAAAGTGTRHLDRFADVVAAYAERPAASVGGLLAYLDAAAVVENGLAPAEVEAVPGRVQVLTVHEPG